jgi:F-type H+-transporting ATPase subunit b
MRAARPSVVLGALAAALLLLLPAAARAEGMPQLDFGNPLTIAQVVWMALIFAVLYLLLARWGLPQVTSVLEMRAQSIDADLDAARQAKATADAAATEVNEATARARAEAQASITAASDRAKAEAAARSATLNEKLDAQLREAEERIAQARASAMGALRQVATETAGAVLARLTGHAPDGAALDGAVGAAMTARGQG